MNSTTNTKRKSSIGKVLPYVLATLLIMTMLVPVFATEHIPAFATEGVGEESSENAEVQAQSEEPAAEEAAIEASSEVGALATDVADVSNFEELKAAATAVNADTIKTINIQSSFDVTEVVNFEKAVTINGNGNTLTDKVTRGFGIFQVSYSANVDIKGLNFTGSDEGYGAAIYMIGTDEFGGGAYATLSVTGGTIKGFKGAGGALYLLGGNVTIKNVNFVDNTANISGGAVNAWLRITGTIDGCTFTGNSAGDGGAIGVTAESNITITNTTISDNTANDTGGAIFVYSNAKVTIGAGTVIENNTATNNGGAIYSKWNSEIILDGGKISGNTAANGGGIYAYANPVTISDSTIAGNTATVSGGGIYTYNSTLSLTRSALDRNTANSEGFSGGGIYSYLSAVTASDTTFSKNVGKVYGGGAVIIDGSFNLSGADSKLFGNSAQYGGAIAGYDYSSGVSVDLKDATFSNNNAVGGGAIYINNFAKLNTKDITFADNHASVGRNWDLSDTAGIHGSFAAVHNSNIIDTTYTEPFGNAYNNYDVYYNQGDSVKVVKIYVEYYKDTLEGTPLFRTEKPISVFAGISDSDVLDVLKQKIDPDWLNAMKPEGYNDGVLQEVVPGEVAVAAIPEILDDDITIKVLYSVTPVTPPTDVEEPEVVVEPETPITIVNVTKQITRTFPAEQVAQIEAQTGNPVVDVVNGNVPKGSMEAQGTWSLLNLLLAIVCALSFVIMFVGGIRNKIERKMAKVLKFAAMAVSMLTIVVWAILEDLTLPMSWINNNTVIIVALFSVFAILTIAFNTVKSRRNEKAKEEVAIA